MSSSAIISASLPSSPRVPMEGVEIIRSNSTGEVRSAVFFKREEGPPDTFKMGANGSMGPPVIDLTPGHFSPLTNPVAPVVRATGRVVRDLGVEHRVRAEVAHPYGHRIGCKVLDVLGVVNTTHDDLRCRAWEDLSMRKDRVAAHSLHHRETIPLIALPTTAEPNPPYVMCPKGIILQSLFWRDCREGYMEYSDLAYYKACHGYSIVIPASTAAIKSFVNLATARPAVASDSLADALAMMEYLGTDQEWAVTWWRMMSTTRRRLLNWQWCAMMDIMLRAEDQDRVLESTMAVGDVQETD
ncbi:hypothetical protein BDN72DRAFT_907126 [Pluteus cervinus]|uniref:Uncharacterized protein n=1 Tax=Pluteus cervinus TaxID=181527 RepID=A0ACD2ZXE1_9AGAR|nr:hypothetical protein BDN72DRAFT_907126 [Pluteus cervinus]